MKNEKKGILADMLSRRRDFVKLLFAALLLAFGTSILANYTSNLFENREIILLYLGCTVICVVLIYLIYSLLKNCNRTVNITGVLVFKNDSNEVVPIDRYELSEKLAETLSAVFLENEALKKHWKKKPETDGEHLSDTAKKNGQGDNKKERDKEQDTQKSVEYYSIVRMESKKEEKSKADKILNEALEHVIIHELSNHLSTYFNHYHSSDKLIKEYSRADFPKILLENRVTNLLSTPFTDRAIFAEADLPDKSKEGEIVAIHGSDGSRFSRFDLILPTGTKVKREGSGTLTLENRRIKFQITVKDDRYTANLPRGFKYNYLGITESRSIGATKVEIEITSRIKPLALLFNRGWEYHKWVDSFIDDLEEFASFSKFLKSINWENNLTRIVISNNRERIRNERDKKKGKKTTGANKT